MWFVICSNGLVVCSDFVVYVYLLNRCFELVILSWRCNFLCLKYNVMRVFGYKNNDFEGKGFNRVWYLCYGRVRVLR